LRLFLFESGAAGEHWPLASRASLNTNNDQGSRRQAWLPRVRDGRITGWQVIASAKR